MQLVDDARREVLARLLQPLNPSKSAGGSAGNTVKSLAALGADSTFIGKVGQDEDARLLSEAFRRTGAQTRFLTSPLHTGVASTFISPSGERTFGTCLGAASTLQAEEIIIDFYLVHLLGFELCASAYAGLGVCLEGVLDQFGGKESGVNLACSILLHAIESVGFKISPLSFRLIPSGVISR